MLPDERNDASIDDDDDDEKYGRQIKCKFNMTSKFVWFTWKSCELFIHSFRTQYLEIGI